MSSKNRKLKQKREKLKFQGQQRKTGQKISTQNAQILELERQIRLRDEELNRLNKQHDKEREMNRQLQGENIALRYGSSELYARLLERDTEDKAGWNLRTQHTCEMFSGLVIQMTEMQQSGG